MLKKYTFMLLCLYSCLQAFDLANAPAIEIDSIKSYTIVPFCQKYSKSYGLDVLTQQLSFHINSADRNIMTKALDYILQQDPLIFFNSYKGFYFIINSLFQNSPQYLYKIANVINTHKNAFLPESPFYKKLTQNYDLDNQGTMSLLHACINIGCDNIFSPAYQNSLDIFIQTLCILAPELLVRKDDKNHTPLEIVLNSYNKNPNYIYLLCTYMQPQDIPKPLATYSPFLKSILTKNNTIPFTPNVNCGLPTQSFQDTGLNINFDISVVTLTLALQNNNFKINGYDTIAHAYYGVINPEPLIFYFIDTYGVKQPYYPEIFTTAFTKNMRADQVNSHGKTALEYAQARNALPEVISLFENKYREEKTENLHNDLALLNLLNFTNTL